MKNIIEQLKKAEAEMVNIPICNWGRVPNQKIKKEYKTFTKQFLTKEDKKSLESVLTMNEWIDVVYTTVINESETDTGTYVWKFKPCQPLSYYIEKLEKMKG